MTVARVTQQYAEVAITPENRNARVTQQYVEVAAATENRAARVTQQYIEAACLLATEINARVTQQYVEVAARQNVPFLQLPLDEATGVSRPVTLSWGRISGALKYQIQIATDIDFLDVVVDDQTAATSYTTPGELAADTTYYWRVRARLA